MRMKRDSKNNKKENKSKQLSLRLDMGKTLNLPKLLLIVLSENIAQDQFYIDQWVMAFHEQSTLIKVFTINNSGSKIVEPKVIIILS